MKIFKLLCLLPFALLGSCSNEEIMPESNPDPTLDKCISILNEFKSQIGEYQTRSTASNVTSFSKKTLRVPIGNMTRSQSSEEAAQNPNDTTEVELCFMELDNGGKKGYAYVCPDERTNGVYAYVPNGCISDTARIAPLDSAIKKIPSIIIGELSDSSLIKKDIDLNPHIFAGPITKCEWGQGYPYNKYIINQYAVGCTPLATAQLIATCKRFKGTYYGNQNIDFNELTAEPTPLDYETSDKIACFLHEVAIYCQPKFGDQTGASVKSAYHYLTELGYVCTYKEGSLDTYTMYKNLTQGKPHIISGFDKNSKIGHTWIIDGIRGQFSSNNQHFSGTLHCNWGQFGSSNGWFAEYTNFQPNHNYSENNSHIYIISF